MKVVSITLPKLIKGMVFPGDNCIYVNKLEHEGSNPKWQQATLKKEEKANGY